MSYRQQSRPTPKDILRYRYQHGTNLGSIFILEQWLFGSMYDQGVSGSSELDAVVASINVRGLDATRQKWEAHWANALTDADLDWLANAAHCNSIRLPIGYFTLGPAFCANTAFAMVPSQVYVNAWPAVKRLVQRCLQYGIGVLIDLHGVPGGANHESHSGTSSGKAELWGNSFNLELATRCLMFVAEETLRDPQLAGVIGIQVCNEAIIDPPGMYEWYNDVIQRIAAVDASLPIYISDGWDLGRAVRFTRAYNNPGTPRCPVIVDTHKYWAFDAKDTSRSPFEIIEQVKTELHELDSTLVGDVFSHQAAVAVYVGEYSLALAPQTWSRAPSGQKDELMRQFGLAQSQRWQSRASGSAFWTFKMDWMPGWDWGFKASSDNGQVVCPKRFTFTVQEIKVRLAQADERKSQLLHDALNGHIGYWTTTSPGAKFEHWRYGDGWGLGWTDARQFFAARLERQIPSATGSGPNSVFPTAISAGGTGLDGTTASHESPIMDENLTIGTDMIGALDLWILKRMCQEGVADSQKCPFGWEFEHGFRKAVSDFQGVVCA
ncbi:uncharacterized protein A1O5_04213 [Cladophialophora psammophila CBS 110553]|uniref:Glycoside hydrolase family 5 domain-containing protein n=1 Tax=Cladophialophora psammophila CBS 110553 TaxID=1182543 RepID=W9XRZ4_9EURO|nr:uncharacterized protein A1O5_04213 [Cladophialophora psammophila CBS 110553]EXJ73064.1 hypothetical protein A1O5_04213 [Cladophialophora psammophila CBS 110553]